MQIYHSLAQLRATHLSPSVRQCVGHALSLLIPIQRHYCPQDDGYVVLIEENDTLESVVEQLGYAPDQLPWEGGYRDGDMLVGVLLRNNQFGLTVIIPNIDGIAPALRRSLEIVLS